MITPIERKCSKRNGHHFLVVLVTCPNAVVARRIARVLVQKNLAACVNIVSSVESIFLWEAKLERSKEQLLIIKTTKACFNVLRQAIIKLHPYDIPEVIALPIVQGHSPYLQWILANTQAY